VSAKETPFSGGTSSAPSKGGARTPVVREVNIANFKMPRASLTQKHVTEAEQMAKVYPVLYVLENSVRGFIDGHLTKAYGANWFDDPRIVPKDVRANVDRVRSAEAVNRAHTSRNVRPIYYTMLGELRGLNRCSR
jgi:hypothetical protein